MTPPEINKMISDYAALSAELEQVKRDHQQAFELAVHHQSRAEAAEAKSARLSERLAEAHRSRDLQWAVDRWYDEVENRPKQNIHYRALDTAWRQVIRYFGGDPDDLLADCPFCEGRHASISAGGFDCPPLASLTKEPVR